MSGRITAVFNDLGKKKIIKSRVIRFQFGKDILGRQDVISPETFPDHLGCGFKLTVHNLPDKWLSDY